jgi:hypothetical protein
MRRRVGWCGKRWCCYFWRTHWTHISLGVHISLSGPNIELHIPFGFIRIGRIQNLSVSDLRECNIEHHRARLNFWEAYRG